MEDQHTKTKEILAKYRFLIKYNQLKTEIPTSNYKMGGTSVKLTFIPFNLVMFTSSAVA